MLKKSSGCRYFLAGIRQKKNTIHMNQVERSQRRGNIIAAAIAILLMAMIIIWSFWIN